MNININTIVLVLALTSIPMTLHATEAAVDSTQDTVESCRTITSPLGRLQCYDGYFPPPLVIVREAVAKEAKHWRHSPHKQVGFWRRHIERTGLLTQSKELRSTKYSGGEARTVVSSAALTTTANDESVTGDPAVLFFQCYQDISSMQLLWPSDLDTGKADVRIWSADKLLLDSSWRALDERFLLSSPHGLPGIDMIKKLFAYEAIKFQITTKQQQYQATFNIDQLKQVITPLGEQCRWL